jgi:Na+-translocating ferredoxin:NAD+ oxidoreductase RNF subunit RnfB
MTKDAHRELAVFLNALPLGFPSAPSGVEMKILRKLFSAAEATVVSKMQLDFESPGQIAARVGEKVEELSQLLERMLSKGLVNGRGPRENREYRVEPYINMHGDLPISQIDSEYVVLFERYLRETFAEELGKVGPSSIRVFPAELSVRDNQSVLTFEQISKIVAEAKHYVVSDCPCCRKMKLVGNDCRRRAHRCISLYYEDDFRPDIRVEYRDGRRATHEEVLNLLKTAEQEGFIHTGPNIQKGHSHICNCCPDCCPFLRMIRLDKSPNIIAPSNYVAQIESESCIACGLCAEEKCPVNAIDLDSKSHKVNLERCIGCGVCVVNCPSGALSLVQKEEHQISIPPLDTRQWFFHRIMGQRSGSGEES